VFKLLIFTVLISEKYRSEQKNAWSRFALILCKLHEILRKITKIVAIT